MIYPMFAMVLLTAFVLATLFRSRVSAVRHGLVSAAYFRIYQGDAEPESSAKRARHFTNLFEAPVLFYVVCLAAIRQRIQYLRGLCTGWTRWNRFGTIGAPKGN